MQCCGPPGIEFETNGIDYLQSNRGAEYGKQNMRSIITDKHVTHFPSTTCTACPLPKESELHHRLWGSSVI